jgi:DNA-binding MarR family transcriptional regulator
MMLTDRKSPSRLRASLASNSAAQQWTGFLLSQCAQRLRAATGAVLEPLSLTPRDVGALEVLARDQPTQVELGLAIGLDRTSVVAMLDRLEQLGCMERKADIADRRANRLRLTVAGQRKLEAARQAAAAAETEVLGALSERERGMLRQLLSKVWRSGTNVSCG